MYKVYCLEKKLRSTILYVLFKHVSLHHDRLINHQNIRSAFGECEFELRYKFKKNFWASNFTYICMQTTFLASTLSSHAQHCGGNFGLEAMEVSNSNSMSKYKLLVLFVLLSLGTFNIAVIMYRSFFVDSPLHSLHILFHIVYCVSATIIKM